MDNNILKILNEELLESKRRTKLAEQRLDLHSKEFKRTNEILDQHKDVLNQHKAGLEILFNNMQKMGDRMDLELKRLRND